MTQRDYKIRAVIYGTDGRHTTRNITHCRNELARLLRALPGVEVSVWTMDRLMDTMYWTAHNELATGAFCGHMSWKPYIINRELMDVDDGDVVLYLDADIRWHSANGLFKFVGLAKERGVSLREYHNPNRIHTKRDTFILMGMDSAKYWDAPHVFGGMIAIERSNRTLQFMNDWLVAALSYNTIARKKSTRGEELPGFILHQRQGLLATLAAHYGIEPDGSDYLGKMFVQKACGAAPRGYAQPRPWEEQ